MSLADIRQERCTHPQCPRHEPADGLYGWVFRLGRIPRAEVEAVVSGDLRHVWLPVPSCDAELAALVRHEGRQSADLRSEIITLVQNGYFYEEERDSRPRALETMKRWAVPRGYAWRYPEHTEVWRRPSSTAGRAKLLFRAPDHGVALLWALAVEIDDRQATRTGEQVCRACGGSGEVIVDIRRAGQRVWSVGQCYGHDLNLYGIEVTECGVDYVIPRDYAVATKPCPCDGPTRPVTVSLARMVRLMATLGEPPYGELTDAWAVDADEMEAADLLGVVLSSTRALGRSAVTPAWMCRWWRAFREWSIAGKLPDAEPLAADLEALTPVVFRVGRGYGKTAELARVRAHLTAAIAAREQADATARAELEAARARLIARDQIRRPVGGSRFDQVILDDLG